MNDILVKVGADVSNFTSSLRQATSEMRSFSSQASSQMSGMQSSANAMSSIGSTMTRNVTLPLVGIGTAATITGAKFQRQMSTVGAVSGATGADMEALSDKAREMGATTMFSATEAGEGMEFLARAGYSTDEIMTSIPSVLDLAAAGAIDLGSAADITSNILSGFGMEASETAKVANILALASARSNVEVQGLGEAFKYVGPVASMAGLSIEDTTAAVGLLGDAGIQGGQAGRMLRSGIQSLLAPSDQAAALMEELGINVFDTNGQLKPMPAILAEFEQGLQGMNAEQRAAALEMIFGTDAMSAWSVLIGAGSEELGTFSNQLENAEGTAAAMHEQMSDNLYGDFQALISALQELSLSFFSVAEGPMRTFVQGLTKMVRWFAQTSSGTKTLIIVFGLLAASIGPILVVTAMLINSFITVRNAIMTLQVGLSALGMSFTSISIPILVAITIIGLMVAAVINLWQTNEEFRYNVTLIWTAVKSIISNTLAAIMPVVSAFGAILQVLIQIMAQLIGWVANVAASFLAWIARMMNTHQWISQVITVLAVLAAIIGTVIGVVAAINAVITIFSAIMGIASTAAGIFGAIMAFITSPIGLVIIAIAAVIGVVIALAQKFEWLGNIVDSVTDWISDKWNSFLEFFGGGTEEAADQAASSIEDAGERSTQSLDETAESGVQSSNELRTGVTENTGMMTEQSIADFGQLEQEGNNSFLNLNTDGTDQTSQMLQGVTGNTGQMKDTSSGHFDELAENGQYPMMELNTVAQSESTDMKDGVTSDIEQMASEAGISLDDLEIDGIDSAASMNTGVTGETSVMSSEVLSQIGDMESNATSDFSSLNKNMTSEAKSTSKNVNNAFRAMGKGIGASFKGINNSVTQSMKQLSTDISRAMRRATQTVRTSTNQMKNVMKTGMNGMVNVSRTSFRKMDNLARTSGRRMTSTAKSSMNAVKSAYRSGFNAAASSARSGMNKALNAVRSTNRRIVADTRRLRGQLHSAGAQAMAGLQSGLNSRRGGVMATARGIANSVSRTIKKSLKVKSPSRVLMDIGRDTGLGLEVGLRDSVGRIEKESRRMAQAAVPDVDLAYNSAGGIYGNLSSAVRGSVDVNNNDDKIIGAINRLERRLTDLTVEMDGERVGRITRSYINKGNAIDSRVNRFRR